MLNNISRAYIVSAWIGLVAVLGATAVAAGAHLSVGIGLLCLVVAVLPPAVLMLLWHGTPAASMKDLLYAPGAVARAPGREGRR